ncbi:MAG: YlxR family protein [Acidimicrobiia bacterium]|nr:YlxR family protein [Acidimicrobiia bacterium]
MADPQRTCVGCRAVRSQTRLLRLAVDSTGVLSIGRTSPGRGAWLCRDTVLSCFDAAVNRNGFERSLGRPIRLASPMDLRSQLERLQNTP